METLARGYHLAEAPVATGDGGVVFSDVLGGGVHQWSPTTGAVETIVPKRRGIGGMARHADGGLVLCFGGADGRDLFITTPDNTDDPPAGGVVLRTRVGVAGAPIPAAAARTPDE